MVIAVFFGGKSCEHDVSVVTGFQAMSKLCGHVVLPIFITREGEWRLCKKNTPLSRYMKGKAAGKQCFLRAASPNLYVRGGRKKRVDAALICCHGVGGEDGCLQGVLETAGIPYTCSGVAASGVGLDKRLSKLVFGGAGLNQVAYEAIMYDEWTRNSAELTDKCEKIGYPLIVKPSRLGSSIGVGTANNREQLFSALCESFEWDNCVIVEKKLEDFVEYNCAVMRDGNGIIAGDVEKPLRFSEILTFADKYERGGFKGESAREFPASVSDELARTVRETAVAAYKAIGADGIARVDFLYANDTLYVNEINTVPGSLALYLLPSDALEKLLSRAVVAHREKSRLRYLFESGVRHGKK